MKNFSFSLFNVFSVFGIILIIILILIPFNLINMEQAQRVAKWLNVYEKMRYSFDLINLHEGKIIPTGEELGKILDDKLVMQILSPYLNLEENKNSVFKKYSYAKMNGSPLEKDSQFYFKEFYKTKDGMLISLKEKQIKNEEQNQPLYFMFIDINGTEKPNRIGQDIFFLSVFRDKISTVGYQKPYKKLKVNCSPLGSGIYCSEYYLHSGSF